MGFFSALTLNGQLEDHEELFAELDKECMGLELRTAELIGSVNVQRFLSLTSSYPCVYICGTLMSPCSHHLTERSHQFRSQTLG